MRWHDFGPNVRSRKEPLYLNILIDAAIPGLNVNRAVSKGLHCHLSNASIWFWNLKMQFRQAAPEQKYHHNSDKSEEQRAARPKSGCETSASLIVLAAERPP